MKSRLLWMFILTVGSTALYFGIARPEVSTTPRRIQDYLDVDPATRPPVELPPFVVSESRTTAADAVPRASGPESKL